MGFQCARGARGASIARLGFGAKRRGDIPGADLSRSQQDRATPRQIDDRRFDADLAGPTVKDQINFFTQIIAHMFRGGRADAAESVGGWRRDTLAELTQQLQSDRMPGYAQTDRVLAAGELITHTRHAPQYKRQRPGPEARCEFRRGIGNLARPTIQFPDIADMNDEGMARGTALDLVDSRDRCGVGCVGAQSVDRFGRKSNQATAPQYRDGIPNRNRLGRVDSRRQVEAGRSPCQPGNLVFFTASAWPARNRARRLASLASLWASIATAKSPALAAPASPIAKVATGIPLGICTIESSESNPRRYLDGIGTPRTGTVVFAAITPARCAAPPAPAMKQRAPFALDCSTHSASASGERCAESTLAS